jgi:hypothetical protein
MIRFLLRRALASAERSYGESLEYLRVVLRASLSAFFRFVRVALVSRYRRALPVGPHHVVRILAAKHEDCGPCVQTTIDMARSDGLSSALLRAVVDGNPEDLPEELADVYRFVGGILRASDATKWRSAKRSEPVTGRAETRLSRKSRLCF